MDWLDELREYVGNYSTAPTFEKMPRLTLEDKGINGPTGAHRIEEIHTPLNFDYITITTGTTAFQNIVGVTASEIGDRVNASKKAFELCGLSSGDEMLITYPPLINVFPKKALLEYEIPWSFLQVSSRDALILKLCEWYSDNSDNDNGKVILGESTFIRSTLESAKRMGILEKIPKNLTIIAAGTPLDLSLLPIAESIGAKVHDLYGCQEFGWLTLDGIPLRDDIILTPSGEKDLSDLLVGGLPTGDRFPLMDSGHICKNNGKIITYSRVRTSPDMETTVLQTSAKNIETIERLTRSVLRIKAKIVRISPDIVIGADKTILSVSSYMHKNRIIIEGPKETRMFDSLLEAQMKYQSRAKNDPTWNKER